MMVFTACWFCFYEEAGQAAVRDSQFIAQKTGGGTSRNHFTMMPSRQLEISTRCAQPQSQYLPYIRKKEARWLPGILSFTFSSAVRFPSFSQKASLHFLLPSSRSLRAEQVKSADLLLLV